MPTLKAFLVAVCKTGVISLVSITLTHNLSQGVYLKLFHHHIKFHPDQMKVREKISQQVLLCADLVTPRLGQGQWNGIKINGRSQWRLYAWQVWKIWLKTVLWNVQRLNFCHAWQLDKHNSLHRSIHVISIWNKNCKHTNNILDFIFKLVLKKQQQISAG